MLSGSYIKLVNSTVAAGSMMASLQWLIGTVVVSSGVMMLAKRAVDLSGTSPHSHGTCELDC